MNIDSIATVVNSIILENPDKATQARQETGFVLLGWFVGQAMKRLQGHADPGLVLDCVKQQLGDEHG